MSAYEDHTEERRGRNTEPTYVSTFCSLLSVTIAHCLDLAGFHTRSTTSHRRPTLLVVPSSCLTHREHSSTHVALASSSWLAPRLCLGSCQGISRNSCVVLSHASERCQVRIAGQLCLLFAVRVRILAQGNPLGQSLSSFCCATSLPSSHPQVLPLTSSFVP